MSSQPAVLQSNFLNRNVQPFLTIPSASTKYSGTACFSSFPSVKLNARPPQACFSLNKNNDHSTPTSILPPGPWQLPLIGNIHQLVGHLPHSRLRDLGKIYGPVMSVQLGEVSAVVVSSVEAAKEVLRIQDVIFAERPPVLMAEIVLYNRHDIVFGSYGDHWRQLRKICTLELLSLKRVQSFKSVREDEFSNFIKYLSSKAGTPVNLTHDLFSLTNSVMLRTSIGKKCKNQEAILRIIDSVVAAGGGFSVADVFPSFKLLHMISGDRSSLEALRRDTDEILDEIINEHKAGRKAGDDHDEAENLLDVLLDLQENGDLEVPLTNDSIKATILDMFGAGSDTSSKTAEWALSELMRHPEIMKKAQEEVRGVFGDSGEVDETRLHELKYLKLVIKETLRLHPAIPLIPRECRERTKINGYDVYPKTKVLVNIWAISRDPNIWSEADKFKPERFLNSSLDYKGNYLEFAPFGSGKRVCPGMTLGITNLELILAKLLYHFDWKLPDGITPETLDMTESVGGAIKRRTDLNLIPVLYPTH
ncbi:premnaspirodiene oxygenase [Ricinus communis]|uniref:CYP726A18 n=1 Tax=Ricinus communis TaxID=3988 RepID=B9RHX3_RICCO|nr:premnaspirodiene oxygenase [Ricinus communis]AIM47549.1 CYP726A18 [Ricinus communis]EEF48745.1 cytochrome P450, putative [Ricinus communis]|eukprot:NP_001310627.1 premnaspirodiene oxygenase [Ricinus communis]